MMQLSKEYWDKRYKDGETDWDLGAVAPPLKEYFDQLQNKDLNILVPGGGNSYEPEYLHQLGFNNVHVVDFSSTGLENIKLRDPSFPQSQLINENFFELRGSYDLTSNTRFSVLSIPF